MKIFTIVFTIIAIGLIIFNITQIDLNNSFEDTIITIFASLCAILLLQILRLSKNVEEQLKRRK